MDFKTFFVFKGETTLRALVWFEFWFIFFLVLIVTIWVFYIFFGFSIYFMGFIYIE